MAQLVRAGGDVSHKSYNAALRPCVWVLALVGMACEGARMADLYLAGFNRGPARALMPARRRVTGALQVWVRDSEGERLIAYVAERREAVGFAFKVWAIRGSDRLEVTLRRPARGAAAAVYELVASNLHTRRGIPGVPLGGDSDNPCECARHGVVVALPIDWCYLETMKYAALPEVSTPATARAKAFRHLNVRMSPAVRDLLTALVAGRKSEDRVTGAAVVEELIRAASVTTSS